MQIHAIFSTLEVSALNSTGRRISQQRQSFESSYLSTKSFPEHGLPGYSNLSRIFFPVPKQSSLKLQFFSTTKARILCLLSSFEVKVTPSHTQFTQNLFLRASLSSKSSLCGLMSQKFLNLLYFLSYSYAISTWSPSSSENMNFLSSLSTAFSKLLNFPWSALTTMMSQPLTFSISGFEAQRQLYNLFLQDVSCYFSYLFPTRLIVTSIQIVVNLNQLILSSSLSKCSKHGRYRQCL